MCLPTGKQKKIGLSWAGGDKGLKGRLKINLKN